MSQTLGEKLRQAREERGISIAEVAEQTRISPFYIESIERDDYKPLPGGIFNKGFVKSFAKYVDIDEQQALADYTSLVSSAQPAEEVEPRSYRPEVLTDDRSGRSMAPTIIMAVVILGLMTAGILFGLNYLQNRSAGEPTNANANNNSNTANTSNTNTAPSIAGAPDMSTLKVEFKAVGTDISLSVLKDSARSITSLVKSGETVAFDPKENLKLSYSRSLASAAQLFINGKSITTPAQPTAKRNIIEFEINKANLPQIWQSGSISPETASEPTANVAVPAPSAGVRPPAGPKPTTPVANSPAANTANTAKPANKPAATPKPATTPAGATVKPKPQ